MSRTFPNPEPIPSRVAEPLERPDQVVTFVTSDRVSGVGEFAILASGEAWVEVGLGFGRTVLAWPSLWKDAARLEPHLRRSRCGYVPLVLLGRAIWLRWSSRISVGHFALLSIASWCVFVWAVDRRQPDSFDPGNSYGVSMGLAYGVFVVALLLEPTIRRRWYVTWVSERSYSIYLLHLYTGVLVLDALSGHAPYTLALVLALLATIVASEFTYRFVERPMRRFARGLSNGGLRRTVAPRLVRARFGSSSYTLTERT